MTSNSPLLVGDLLQVLKDLPHDAAVEVIYDAECAMTAVLEIRFDQDKNTVELVGW